MTWEGPLIGYGGDERRRKDRRRNLWGCQACGGSIRLAGSPHVGAQIAKCVACGRMDQRLPGERRLNWGPGKNGYKLGSPMSWRNRFKVAAAFVAFMVLVSLSYWALAVVRS